MSEKIVSVAIIIIGSDTEFSCLDTSFSINRPRLAVLLRYQRSCRKPTKLHLGLYTEKRSTASDKRRAGSHAHITGFYTFYNVVLLTFVLQFYIFRIKIKCSIGIVIHVELHTISYRSVDRRLYLLTEVKVCLATCRKRQRRIIGLIAFYSR